MCMMCDNPRMELNMSALLLAIAMVESGNKPEAIGAKGEVSQYQITKPVWRKHAPNVIFDPKQPWQATAVATKHIRLINGNLHPALRNRPFWIAVAWNGGPGAVEKSKVNGEYSARHVPKKVQDYADRVRAMYHIYEKDARCVKPQVSKHKKPGDLSSYGGPGMDYSK